MEAPPMAAKDGAIKDGAVDDGAIDDGAKDSRDAHAEKSSGQGAAREQQQQQQQHDGRQQEAVRDRESGGQEAPRAAGQQQQQQELEQEQEQEEEDSDGDSYVEEISPAAVPVHARVPLLLRLFPGIPLVQKLEESPRKRRLVEDMTPQAFAKLVMVVQSRAQQFRKRRVKIQSLAQVASLIKGARRILVLTGAGISTSCGIPDFRSSHGVYSMLDGYKLKDPQDLFSIHYFRRNTKPFYDFARKLWPGTHEPAPTHHFIKRLEAHGHLHRNYTQNIDTLECVAGIERVLQCHGSFATATCTRCKFRCEGDRIKDDIMNRRAPVCPRCAENPPSSLMEEVVMRDPSMSAFRFASTRSNSISSESDLDSDAGASSTPLRGSPAITAARSTLMGGPLSRATPPLAASAGLGTSNTVSLAGPTSAASSQQQDTDKNSQLADARGAHVAPVSTAGASSSSSSSSSSSFTTHTTMATTNAAAGSKMSQTVVGTPQAKTTSALGLAADGGVVAKQGANAVARSPQPRSNLSPVHAAHHLEPDSPFASSTKKMFGSNSSSSNNNNNTKSSMHKRPGVRTNSLASDSDPMVPPSPTLSQLSRSNSLSSMTTPRAHNAASHRSVFADAGLSAQPSNAGDAATPGDSSNNTTSGLLPSDVQALYAAHGAQDEDPKGTGLDPMPLHAAPGLDTATTGAGTTTTTMVRPRGDGPVEGASGPGTYGSFASTSSSASFATSEPLPLSAHASTDAHEEETQHTDGPPQQEEKAPADGSKETATRNDDADDAFLDELPFVDEMFDKGIMKPDIVFFGESLPSEFFDCIEEDVRLCDLVLVLGTSLKVAPVSRIIEMVDEDIPQILINREVVAQPHEFDAELLGNCDAVVTALAKELHWDIPGVPENDGDDDDDDNGDDDEADREAKTSDGEEPEDKSNKAPELKGCHYRQSEDYSYRFLFRGANEDCDSEFGDDSDSDSSEDEDNGENENDSDDDSSSSSPRANKESAPRRDLGSGHSEKTLGDKRPSKTDLEGSPKRPRVGGSFSDTL
ncbi:NAD-dependent deacetylase sir2D [Hondaea fermentalgiana]|uniref:NAD-dependent deacetylase sir2D n=1 Tax=Hondaea fermentalgiana TaxID=2315210 RepID=A0A2R5GJJ0_9STRA|nr:NAD-dependent deacetylase sir2D [Hondaea fermentalgiana]|eukprot:GBG31050.1 NAD-dependent deacetylase sir2D [Hondaea fermentalgiana]